jgi:glycosyltransferase involved in cell wall biosynthesis
MVIHCFFPESVGGSENYTLTLSRKLIERGWDVTIVSGIKDLTRKRYEVTEGTYEGITTVKINNPPELYSGFSEYFTNSTIDGIVRETAKKERPGIIHFQHTAYLSSRLPEIAREMGIPSIFTLHDYWYMCYRSQLLRPMEGICPGPSEGINCATCYDPVYTPNVSKVPLFNRMLQLPLVRNIDFKRRLSPEMKRRIKDVLYRKISSPSYHPDKEAGAVREHVLRIQFMKQQLLFPHRVVSPSRYLKKRYEREGFREILHVPHGFDAKHPVAHPAYDGKLVLAYLSNIVPFKGPDVILRELRFVHRRRDIKILFYGKVLDEIYQHKLEAMAEAYPDVDISFKGPYSGKGALEEILRGVHCVVFPSLWEENQPLVIGEAMQYGVPVISTSLGGAPEAIEDGKNGFVFDPYKEGDLARVLTMLQEHPELIRKVTKGAEETELESLDEHTDTIEGIYRGLL